MKKISLSFYQKEMGSLISIPYQKFMLYYDRYLNKNEPYYFICSKGFHSAKVVRMLEYFGYDVTQVVKDDVKNFSG